MHNSQIKCKVIYRKNEILPAKAFAESIGTKDDVEDLEYHLNSAEYELKRQKKIVENLKKAIKRLQEEE